ncbi:hypothetical protein QSV34_01315 [Porticoccus sp. W117]|uniref:hypothetical protein n=1 Tax=Porticoccus sp. W117 TaxID=3054777 RepID=UPI0025920949|nr:hypothetical protein [Porticoccus sp. W117]MDM3869985.1 hypothetical protein [Porticoccus sp. W117]
MSYLVTLILTLAVLAITLWVFVRIGTPVYRIERSNVITLLQMVVDGTASESDWDVFIGMPIQYDSELEAVRQRCAELTEEEYTGGTGLLFTEQGMTEIAEILDSLVAG